jgi:hypothetical protein
MPKSRSKTGSSKNVAALSSSSAPPTPLLDCLLGQNQPSITQNNDLDNSKVIASGWECNTDDWSIKTSTNNGEDLFPPSLRSVEKKSEQAKNKHLQFTPTTIHEIDILHLSSTVTDLMTGKRDGSAYTDFLLILKKFSVRASRDDHLEQTVYHLIQAAVTFIRANEQRFDREKLEECYRQRHNLKTTSIP